MKFHDHSYLRLVVLLASTTLCFFSASRCAIGEDWPTYLHDYDRAGVTTESLQLPLQTAWIRHSSGALKRAWSAPEGRSVEGKDLYDRVRFDDAFQVAVVGDRIFFGSSVDHKLYCLDVRSGKELWNYFTGAGIRLAPTVVDGRVYVGSG